MSYQYQPDPPGDWRVTEADDIPTNTSTIVVEQRLDVLYGAHLQVTKAFLEDAAVDVAPLFDAFFDRRFRPWRYPDPNPMPRFVLFKWLPRRWQ